MTDEAWAKSLLLGIEKTQAAVKKDPRSTAYYWNCDDFGSIDGFRDAANWSERQVVNYILKRVRLRDRSLNHKLSRKS